MTQEVGRGFKECLGSQSGVLCSELFFCCGATLAPAHVCEESGVSEREKQPVAVGSRDVLWPERHHSGNAGARCRADEQWYQR